jgi:hypothetical protein
MKAESEERHLTPAIVREAFEEVQGKTRPRARQVDLADVRRLIVQRRLMSAREHDEFAAQGLAVFVRSAVTAKTKDGVLFAQPVKQKDGRVLYVQPPLMDFEEACGWVAMKNSETMADRTSILPTYRLLHERFGDELTPLVKIEGD